MIAAVGAGQPRKCETISAALPAGSWSGLTLADQVRCHPAADELLRDRAHGVGGAAARVLRAAEAALAGVHRHAPRLKRDARRGAFRVDIMPHEPNAVRHQRVQLRRLDLGVWVLAVVVGVGEAEVVDDDMEAAAGGGSTQRGGGGGQR